MSEKFKAQIIADGRITLPKEIREKYNLHVGDRMWFIGDIIPVKVIEQEVAFPIKEGVG
jgi:AbrB family looped-hinge helix DNA binding protein